MSDSSVLFPILPNEIIREILLRLPPKSSLRFMSLSKSCHQLISSPDFVNTHLKLNSHHRLLFRGLGTNFRSCSLLPLFNKGFVLCYVASPLELATLATEIMGSVNGLICLFSKSRKTYIWNPTINKSKKLPMLQIMGMGYSRYSKYGFGYDESRDDYKLVVVDYCVDSPFTMSYQGTVVNIYSFRTDSWTTHHDKLKRIFLITTSGKYVNGNLYWAASTGFDNYNVQNIIFFDLAEERWGRLELPSFGKGNSYCILGVVGSDLSLLYTCGQRITTSHVWIMRDCGINVIWTKLFTIKHPQDVGVYMCSSPIFTFSIHFREGEILLLLPPFIMIYDGSTRQLKHIVKVKECLDEQIFVESLVDPQLIAERGCHNHETSQSLS